MSRDWDGQKLLINPSLMQQMFCFYHCHFSKIQPSFTENLSCYSLYKKQINELKDFRDNRQYKHCPVVVFRCSCTFLVFSRTGFLAILWKFYWNVSLDYDINFLYSMWKRSSCESKLLSIFTDSINFKNNYMIPQFYNCF